MSVNPELLAKAYYSIPEICARWDVSDRTIYREIKRGRLKRKHIGGQVRFARSEVERYEAEAG